jgi:hypothetical protein
VSGLRNIYLGDNRFYNNIFVKRANGTEHSNEDMAQFYGLHGYKIAGFENISGGNIYYNDAKPGVNDTNFLEIPDFSPSYELVEKGTGIYLQIELDGSIYEVYTTVVTTEDLGSTIISGAIYETPEGEPYLLDTDFLGNKRDAKKPLPGPFEHIDKGKGLIRVW